MEKSLQMKLLRDLFPKEGEEGFSLIELVVVVSVLAVLSAIAIPTFSCFQIKAQATAALAAMKQIQTECEINKADTGNADTFTSSNLNSYQIQSDGSNGCGGASGTGLITAIPSDTNRLPSFVLANSSSKLTYDFKDQTGSNFSDCFSMLCGVVNGGNNLKAQIEANEFVLEDSYLERGCSAYAVVEGPTWDQSQANAKKLGGNLITVNDKEESDWITEKVKWAQPADTSSGAYGAHQNIAYWIGLTDSKNEGELQWVDGSEVNYSGQGSTDAGGSEDYFTLTDNGDFNDLTQNPGDWSMGHWQMQYGIAEISICD